MRIEKLELIGFKSFADRTSFALHPGITCIVGPNGCGKSNIVDAFRWVLGEQSAKSLRGEKMEEVIFSGSASKKQKGMAEVTLVVSGLNVPGSNPDNPSEHATVTRRLYRSGESEYLINKTQCRLKDIKDVFLDTGLDFKSYSILEQGRIAEILNSKPIDRRFIIEEVAGVMKYKIRRAEALSKLESSRGNLLRVNDIVAEVKKQINILDRLAKKAERYKKLTAEMHAIELKIARVDYQNISDAAGLTAQEYDELAEKETLMAAEISEMENRTQSRRIEQIEKEKALELIQKEFQTMERDIAEAERSIAVGKNDIENLRDYHSRLSGQKQEVEVQSASTSQKSVELEENRRALEVEVETQSELLRTKNEMFRAVEEELSEKESSLDDLRKALFRISEELSSLRNELARHQAALESQQRKEDSSARESEEAGAALLGIEEAIGRVEASINGSMNETLLLKEKKEVLTGEISEGRQRLETLLKKLATGREELAAAASRLDSLREIVLDRPVRELITSGSGVNLGASISDVIEVGAEYEKAVEAALSDKADMFILGGLEEVEKAVLSVKGKGSIKSAFIPASPHRMQPVDAPPEGVIGRAINFVRVKEGYEAIAENLLGRILIIKDLQAAWRLLPLNGVFTFVTLDGEVVEPSGAVVAGEGKGIFKRRREIRELEEAVEDKKASIEKLNSEVGALRDEIAGNEEEIKTVESSIYAMENEISLARLTLKNNIEDKERISRKMAYLKMELEEGVRERESINAGIAKINAQVSAVEARKADVENESALLQEAISGKKAEIEDYRAEVTEIRLSNASNREKLESLKKEIETCAASLQALGRKKEELSAEQESVLSRISERESSISEQDEKLRKIVVSADALRADISAKKELIDRENEDLLAVDQELRGLRQRLSEVTHRISELDVQRTEQKMKMENLVENVRNNYGMDLPLVELQEVTEEEETRLSELKAKIQEMGPVNLGTIEEYEELSTRYEFLTKQQDDLNKSIAELEEAISKINSTTRKKLRDAFELLNTKFGEVFRTLFGGGKAELVLTDEHNILETGIEIIAQPPGKKLQNLHLLSGGEKALTALSIQFASFLIKPTPLCILDEADAPLDESNTDRYSKMIKELSGETQFIVVTHNRTTMAVGRHLYGITMEEAGVSKVISMQLSDTAAA